MGLNDIQYNTSLSTKSGSIDKQLEIILSYPDWRLAEVSRSPWLPGNLMAMTRLQKVTALSQEIVPARNPP